MQPGYHNHYPEKIDTQKSFRYLETQIKALTESNKNRNEGETWLLAKKPLNGFLCASCESYIKDLNTKNEYVPWNRYPQRDDKTYRMGHGFSRMLQLVNADLLKKQEMMKEQGKNYPSDDERNDKGNRIQSGKFNRDVKLPIVGNQRGNSAFNRSHNYQNLQNNQNVQSQQIGNNNFRINPITIQQNARNDKGDFVKDDNNDPFKNGENNDDNQPKITKIVKLNKGPSTIEINDVKINNKNNVKSLNFDTLYQIKKKKDNTEKVKLDKLNQNLTRNIKEEKNIDNTKINVQNFQINGINEEKEDNITLIKKVKELKKKITNLTSTHT